MTIKKDSLAKGVKRFTSEGHIYIVIDISIMYSGAPNVKTLAKDFRLATGAVLSALLYNASNTDARLTVFADQSNDTPVPSTNTEQFLREQLIRLAFEYGESSSGRQAEPTKQLYEDWVIFPSEHFLTLPLSEKFTTVLEGSPAFLKRERQMKLATTSFESLSERLKILAELTASLGTHLKQLDVELTPFAETCQKLDIAEKVMALMRLEPKFGILPDETVQLRMLENKANLDDLVKLAHKHMLYESPVPKIVRRRDAVRVSAEQLETELNNLVKDLNFYAENKEFAPAKIHDEIQRLLTEAYTQLLASPLANKIVAKHIIPLIDVVCSINPAFSMNGKISNSAFEQGLLEASSLPSLDTAASVYTNMILTLGPQAFGNIPGPYSFAVSVASAAQAHIESVLAGSPAAAHKLGGRLLRFAVISGNFNQQRFDQVAAAIEANDFAGIRKLDWSRSFQAGPVISGFVSIFFFAALLRNVTSDGPVTLKRCADLLQPVLGTALGVFQAMEGISRLSTSLAPYKAGMQAGVPRVLAFAAMVSALCSVSNEFFAQDPEGLVIAGLGTAGALLSVAGFLGFAGTVLDTSIAGIPLGIVLQVAGAVLGIVTTIVSAIRDADAPGVFTLLQGILGELETPKGPFEQVAISRPELARALAKLNGRMDDSHFWFISPDNENLNLNLLADLGLAVQHIERIVDENDLFVKARLPAEKTRELN